MFKHLQFCLICKEPVTSPELTVMSLLAGRLYVLGTFTEVTLSSDGALGGTGTLFIMLTRGVKLEHQLELYQRTYCITVNNLTQNPSY